MQIEENFRKFPIKFYRKTDGTIHYENPFLSGDAKTMEQAFKIFKDNNWERDFIYYYNDIVGVEFGAFEPALKDRKHNGMTYLGQLNLRIDVDPGWGTDEHSVTYLSKHPEAHKDQAKFVTQMKREEQFDKFKSNLKDKLNQGVKKLVGAFQHEMFFPYKTRKDLICDHCGSIIPTGCYYEENEGKVYHIECIWDKLVGNKPSNTFEKAKEYFMSLQRFIGKWPANLDVEDDYITDLELVRSNDRRFKM